MKQLTLQLLIGTHWFDAATLTLTQPADGSASPTQLGYELDYALQWLDKDDEHACSLTLPVQLMMQHEAPQWFRFLDDIAPSGAARRHWVSFLGLQNASPAVQDMALLEQGTIAPVGNLRIKESLPERAEGSTLQQRRFSVEDVVERNSDFLEYAQAMGAISGGATGAGGEAPKLLVRCSADDEIWIDSWQHSFTEPDQHYLVKFPRGKRSQDDCDILRAEYHFYHELTAMGIDTIATRQMRLLEGERYPSLWLPRFDTHWQGNHWQRYGLESIFSVLNKPAGSYLKHTDVLTEICTLLSARNGDFDQQQFVCNWVQRDLLNIAFGNSDNHGRNSALLKKPNQIQLAPVYDFAPMKADPEGVTRTTTWGSPLEEGGEYRWPQIANALHELCPPEKVMNTLCSTATQLQGLHTRLQQRGVPERILTMPATGFAHLDDKLKRWGLL